MFHRHKIICRTLSIGLPGQILASFRILLFHNVIVNYHKLLISVFSAKYIEMHYIIHCTTCPCIFCIAVFLRHPLPNISSVSALAFPLSPLQQVLLRTDFSFVYSIYRKSPFPLSKKGSNEIRIGLLL